MEFWLRSIAQWAQQFPNPPCWVLPQDWNALLEQAYLAIGKILTGLMKNGLSGRETRGGRSGRSLLEQSEGGMCNSWISMQKKQLKLFESFEKLRLLYRALKYFCYKHHFFGLDSSMQKSPCQELHLCHSNDPGHSSDNTRSLTYCPTRELHVLFVYDFIYLCINVRVASLRKNRSGLPWGQGTL